MGWEHGGGGRARARPCPSIARAAGERPRALVSTAPRLLPAAQRLLPIPATTSSITVPLVAQLARALPWIPGRSVDQCAF